MWVDHEKVKVFLINVKSTMSGGALYTAVPLEDEQPENENMNFNSPFKYESAFDFSSIARFQKASFPPKSYFKFSKQNDKGLQAPVPGKLLYFVVFQIFAFLKMVEKIHSA